MNKSYTLAEDDSGYMMYRRIYLLISENWSEWQSVGALFGLACGMLSIVAGGLLWIVVHSIAAGRLGASLNLMEAIFFALSLPLLALGAYCLDILEKRPTVLSSPAVPQSTRYSCQLSIHPKLPPGN